MHRAVFLDRDGTLIAEKHYLHRVADVEILPGTGPALRALAEAGYLLFMVTNQSGIGRGYFTLADAEAVNAHLCAALARDGVRFERIYLAPEAPDQPSRGRKPSPQFLFDARDELQIELAESFMIGDKLIDLECGWNAGVKKSILLRSGYGAALTLAEADKLIRAMVFDDLTAATRWILTSSAAQ